MSAEARSRDRSVATMRVASAGLALVGLAMTGGLAGVFAREMAPGDESGAASGDAQRRRLVVIVHDGPPGAPAVTPTESASPVRAQPAPSLSTPPEPTAPAVTSSGSDPS